MVKHFDFFIVRVWMFFLQEIVSIYPVLSPPNLTPAQSNRVCNALALLQVRCFLFYQLYYPLFCILLQHSDDALKIVEVCFSMSSSDLGIDCDTKHVARKQLVVKNSWILIGISWFDLKVVGKDSNLLFFTSMYLILITWYKPVLLMNSTIHGMIFFRFNNARPIVWCLLIKC